MAPVKPYGALSPKERERAWQQAQAEGGPLAAPLGFHAHAEQRAGQPGGPPPPYRPTPKRLRKQRRLW